MNFDEEDDDILNQTMPVINSYYKQRSAKRTRPRVDSR
jgi:hypothetical protein